ncbi:MAG TPA: pyrroline-5-carboxylate reductase [Phycisphaerales bacterium]|nr:pyrroline-5-carboxylate reductase [Phycisphaerales bacterium]
MSDYELGVIGAGNMAEALLRGVIGGNVLHHGSIVVADPVLERRRLLLDALHIAVVEDNAVPAACPRVLLAVKPQVLGRVLEHIAPVVRPDAMVISIAAGVPTRRIDAALGGRGRILRVMPNTPMLVGAGAAAVAPGPRATDDDLRWVERLFAACGSTCVVAESAIDAVTAVSGSGPAYFFYLIEAMIAAAVAEGLESDQAARLAAQTCAGAARLLAETGERPEVLRARVTSPGGTTQRAVETLDAAGVKDALIRAVRAAAARSRELGQG